jgi:16S rRNA (uracil1498-N3)-methyltransferase
VEEVLSADAALSFEGAQANYLVAVMRLGEGAQVKLFDDRTGEWLAEIADAGKKRVTLRIVRHLREREEVPDLWLLFAPIKRGRIDWIVEKATELGAARLLPVITQRTIVDRTKPERLFAHMVEAAEQCERTALPKLAEPQKLEALLKAWPSDRYLLFADEQGGRPMLEALAPGPAAILIGPEGGFTQEEREAIRSLPQARPVSLGPRILRAETAAIAALSVYMAAAGDWSSHAVR